MDRDAPSPSEISRPIWGSRVRVGAGSGLRIRRLGRGSRCRRDANLAGTVGDEGRFAPDGFLELGDHRNARIARTERDREGPAPRARRSPSW